jgi:hypothetical protein
MKKFLIGLLTISLVAAQSIEAQAFYHDAHVPAKASTFIFRGGIGQGGGGGGDVLLTAATCVNPAGSSQSSLVCSGGIPFGSTQMDSTKRLKVVDNDTGTEIPCQEDNRVTDLSGTAVRFEGYVCLTTSATANEAKQLTMYASSSSGPISGTDITVSDITSYLSGLGKNPTVTLLNLNNSGNDYTASLNTALTSGNSGWVNKATPTVMGTYRSGGGLATTYEFYVPFSHSGTPDSQMNATFDVTCFKSARTAVSGINVINGCKIVPILRNGWANASSPANNYFGLCVTISTACDLVNLPNTTTSTSITILCHSVLDCAGIGRSNNTIPATAAGSYFTQNMQGQLIVSGTGYVVIDGYTNGTTATVSAYKDTGTNTISSGSTVLATTLPYGSEMTFTGWLGFSQQQPDAEQGQVFIGTAWNGTTGGPGTYLASTGAIFNYSFTPSIYNSSADAALMAAMGTNPNGYGAGQNGLSPLYLETTGGRADLGVIPDYNAGTVYRWDQYAAGIMFGQAHRWNIMPYHFLDESTGKTVTPCNAGTLPNCTGSKIYVIDNRFTADVVINMPADSLQPWITDGFAHDPASFFGAMLMSADYTWVEAQQASASNAWMQPNSGTPGQGFQKSLYVSPSVCCGLQGRGTAWAQNALFIMQQFTPDSSTVLPWTKAVVTAYLHNSWGGSTGPTFKTQYLNDTSAGNNYWTTNGPHFFMDLISFPPWQSSFAMMTLAHAREINILDSDGMAEYNWFASNAIQVATDPNVNGQQLSTGYYGVNHMGNTPTCPSPYVDSWTYVNTWQDYYTANALIHPDAAVLFDLRATASTATLSATSGTNVTVSLFNDGTRPFKTHAFYVGGWVKSNDGGRGQITSVIDDYTVTIDTTVTKAYANSSSGCGLYSGAAFGTTSYSGGFYQIPAPAPTDVIGTNWTSNAGGFDFTDLMQRSAGFSKQWGETNGATAYATMLGYTGGVPKTFYPIKWSFSPRTVLPFLPLDTDDVANDNFMPKRLIGGRPR